MNFTICRMQKCKIRDVKGIQIHNQREKESHTIGKYVRLISPLSFNRQSIHSYFDVISYLENEKYTIKSIDAALRNGDLFSCMEEGGNNTKNKKLNQPQKNPTHQISRKQLGRWMWKMRNMLGLEIVYYINCNLLFQKTIKDYYIIT
ncbi:hypothetical protein CN958_27805 [Bacillus cereus]|uniref:Uncharacterized protein n=1 Tax=Bacillus cereus TaxID=1396 RepID=A0A2B9DJI1_BACCE|nr:hypothetical protein CN958_27805 [Bacillus cereus]